MVRDRKTKHCGIQAIISTLKKVLRYTTELFRTVITASLVFRLHLAVSNSKQQSWAKKGCMLSRMTTYGDFRQGRYTIGILTGLQAAFLEKTNNEQPDPKVFTSLALHISKLGLVIIYNYKATVSSFCLKHLFHSKLAIVSNNFNLGLDFLCWTQPLFKIQLSFPRNAVLLLHQSAWSLI